VEFARFLAPFIVQVEADEQLMRLIERVRQIGEPARTLCRPYFGRYAHIESPRAGGIMHAKPREVPCLRVRYGAEIV